MADVNRCGRSWITVIVFVAASSVAASAFADLRSSATAMACCVKTHNQCAGLSTPDDCCHRMGHTVIHNVAGVAAKAQPSGLTKMAAVPGVVAVIASPRIEPNADLVFKRPHDPPHLHSFSLLI